MFKLHRLVRSFVQELLYVWENRNDYWMRMDWDPISGKPITVSLPDYIYFSIPMAWNVAICDAYGHKIREDNADVENGCSDLSCERCGWSERMWM